MFSRGQLGTKIYSELCLSPQPIQSLGLDLEKGSFQDKEGREYKISSISTQKKGVTFSSKGADLELKLQGKKLSSLFKRKD